MLDVGSAAPSGVSGVNLHIPTCGTAPGTDLQGTRLLSYDVCSLALAVGFICNLEHVLSLML